MSRIFSALEPSSVGDIPLSFATEMLLKLWILSVFSLLVPSSADDDLFTCATDILASRSENLRDTMLNGHCDTSHALLALHIDSHAGALTRLWILFLNSSLSRSSGLR
jgi:hypothetical protein